MPIIVNNVTLPTNGDYIKYNGVNVDKVIINDITVWEKDVRQIVDKKYIWDGSALMSGVTINLEKSYNNSFVKKEDGVIKAYFQKYNNPYDQYFKIMNIDISGYDEIYLKSVGKAYNSNDSGYGQIVPGWGSAVYFCFFPESMSKNTKHYYGSQNINNSLRNTFESKYSEYILERWEIAPVTQTDNFDNTTALTHIVNYEKKLNIKNLPQFTENGYLQISWIVDSIITAPDGLIYAQPVFGMALTELSLIKYDT